MILRFTNRTYFVNTKIIIIEYNYSRMMLKEVADGKIFGNADMLRL